MPKKTQKVKCPNCGLPVPMPLDWEGKDLDESLCNRCYEAKESANV